MAELDAWTNQVIIEVLAEDGFVAGNDLSQRIRKAIREKVLESYHNGCKAGAGWVRREAREAQMHHAPARHSR